MAIAVARKIVVKIKFCFVRVYITRHLVHRGAGVKRGDARTQWQKSYDCVCVCTRTLRTCPYSKRIANDCTAYYGIIIHNII